MVKQATTSRSIPRRVSVKKAEDKPTTQRQLLAQIPRVGLGNATALLDRFGSLEKVLAASAEQLQAVEGIGVRKATLIYDTLHEPDSTYRV